ncbi:hypothetical protein B0H17DRAFT_1150402 [Mycena rosella]|uniref:Uncharacterized protein n=1 Tax=Mycena rosella TaxID=1033263 RepID=A0AAD7FN39_MYCRO|nr:hypothetical protein B0H17DRAFT_1150402 [Mycena rosella]
MKVSLFYTAPFPLATRSHLESILSTASGTLQYEPICDPVLEGFSPSDIFKRLGFSLPPPGYALVADNRTLTELHSNAAPTVLVVSPWCTTPQEQWQLYNGPGDLSLLTPYVRLALLAALAEESASLDPYKEDYYWTVPRVREYTAKLWVMKTLRADAAGAAYACAGYEKDVKEMHALYSTEAAKTGGVFRGLLH